METRLEIIDPRSGIERQLETLDRVCRTIGFFRIPFEVVDEAVRERAWVDATRFFAEDDAVRSAVGFPETGYPYGYAPFAYETLAASTDADAADPPLDRQPGSQHDLQPDLQPDLKESFSVGPDCLGTVIDLTDSARSDPGEAWLRSPSLWPDRPAAMRASWTDLYRAFSDVSADLLSMMALALDLSADHFNPLIDRHSSAMRANHYPALDGPPRPGSLRAGPHSDYGTLTILRTDGVPGLEVQQPNGGWVPVEHEPGTFVVNLGDSIAQWTNDRWRSTVHRVVPVDERARLSMAFFHMANWDARIECLPTCIEPGERANHEPVLAGPWLMSKFQRTVV